LVNASMHDATVSRQWSPKSSLGGFSTPVTRAR
jgi:hypothetical protein